MKKTLLTLSFIVSSCFFAHAQLSDVDVNVGVIQGTIDGQPVIYNGQTGQVGIGTGNGGSVQVNTNTGQVGVSGTIGGVRVGIGQGGASVGNTSGFSNFGFNGQGISGLLNFAQAILVRLAPLLIGLALLALFWSLILFIWKGADNPTEQEKAKKGIAYSILALFVMVSIWGIIAFMGSVVGIGQGGSMPGFRLPGQ